jgi:hypothetical protein
MNRLIGLTLFCLLVINLVQAQDYLIEEKSVSRVFQAEGLSKSEIMSKMESWYSNPETTPKDTIETLDLEKGFIRVRGEIKVLYKNIGTELYPKRSQMADVLEAKFRHTIEMDVEDNAYVVKYYLNEMVKEMYGREAEFLNCINFVEIDEEALEAYNRSMGKVLKMNFVFKKRREIFFENSEGQFQEVSSYILNEAQVNMFAAYDALKVED